MAEREEIRDLVRSVHLETKNLSLAEKTWFIQNSQGKIIGYTGIEKRGANVYLQSLVVDKAYRKLGLGKRLVDMAFESVNEGETLIALTAFWNNKFYKNCGFIKLEAKAVKVLDDVAGREKHKHCTAWGKTKQSTSPSQALPQ